MTENSDNPTGQADAKALARQRSLRAGLFYGLGAYSMWGVFPLYFHALSDVPPWIILCHRIVWSVLFLALVVSVRGEWKAIRPILRSRRNVLLLSAGSVLIALNWLIFIYAVVSQQVVETSLGYFINPLLSVALGMIFLRERLRGWQWVAVLIAGVAVANLALRGTGFPWIAVSLACTFGFYGLVRKKVDINSLHGLLVETALLFPLALAVLAFVPARDHPRRHAGHPVAVGHHHRRAVAHVRRGPAPLETLDHRLPAIHRPDGAIAGGPRGLSRAAGPRQARQLCPVLAGHRRLYRRLHPHPPAPGGGGRTGIARRCLCPPRPPESSKQVATNGT